MRDGAHALPAGVRALRIRGDTGSAAHVRAETVTRLQRGVIAPGTEVVDRLRASRVHESSHVRAHARAAAEHPEHEGLEMREAGILAFHQQHCIPRLDTVALVERLDVERGEVVTAELEKRDGFVLPCVAYPTSDVVMRQP